MCDQQGSVLSTHPQPQHLQVFLISASRPSELLVKRGGQFGHLLLEGHAVVFLLFHAHVAARGEDIAVLTDFFDGGRLPPAGFIFVAVALLPGVIDAGDLPDFFFASVPGAPDPPGGPCAERR